MSPFTSSCIVATAPTLFLALSAARAAADWIRKPDSTRVQMTKKRPPSMRVLPGAPVSRHQARLKRFMDGTL